MPKRTTDFREDLLADLGDPREAEHYLNAALGDSAEMFLVALRDVAAARQKGLNFTTPVPIPNTPPHHPAS